MTTPSGTSTNKDIPTADYTANKDLAMKGRFLSSTAFLLFLHCCNYIELNKLPFIGVTVKDTPHETITVILLTLVFYALYKYWVYKRASELTTNLETYSKRIQNRLLIRRYTKLFSKAHQYALSNGSLVGFQHDGKLLDLASPVDGYPRSRGASWSIYNLKIWSYSSHEESIDPSRVNLFSDNDIVWKIKVHTGVYLLSERDASSSQSSRAYEFLYSFKEYKRVKKLCDLLAYFSLPDFIEKTAPYAIGWTAILTAFYKFYGS